MTLEERARFGAELNAAGKCNCTRAVLKAFEDRMDMDPKTLDALAAGFGSGMGNMEGTCGAVTGAVMAAGLLTKGQGTKQYSKIIMKRFEELSGATVCKVIKGVGGGKALCSCPDCVKNAVLALGEALERERQDR